MEAVRCEGSPICCSDQGQGEALVLLHGFCGSAYYWEKVVPLLEDRFRVIVPDLRGHGASDAPLGAYSMDQMADDVRDLLDALEIEKAVLLGHSMGGYIALSFAQRHASRLNAFGLIHSTAFPDSDEAKEKRLNAVSAIRAQGITSFVDGLVPGLFAPATAESAPELIRRAQEIGYRTPPQGAEGAALGMRERPDRRDVVSASALPVLLVAGEKDGLAPPERVFTSDKPHVVQALIAGAGHMSMMEAPDQLAEIIRDFAEAAIRL
ncbi:alpha/beta fold hydrolase [Paenibacillus spiritus]|uniref:Alpha/beta fold hydrolase n=1 Tax=Paenibacillus spiritus TaxID=2496557 RepID=A0A5J5G4Z3_9BACL|nr:MULTISPECIES: alpha/beta hydrolase [Paenibacillus]KAA9002119.1 alpha/beta fold hydrolase [Paenibacillus spiritus]